MTAEDFINKKDSLGVGFKTGELEQVLIEFAQFHVEAALKDASKKATFLRNHSISEEDDETIIYDYEINKESILNAYPLTNIQ